MFGLSILVWSLICVAGGIVLTVLAKPLYVFAAGLFHKTP